MLEGQRDRVTAIAFQPHSFRLAAASEDGQVYVWKTSDPGGQAVQQLQGADEGFTRLAWHPQGTRLAAGGAGGEIVMWAETK